MEIEASAVPESISVEAPVASEGKRLRASEKVVLVYFACASLAATAFQVAFSQGLTMAVLNLVTGGVILEFRHRASNKTTDHGGEWLAAVRNWFPALMIILAFREAGALCLPDTNYHLDQLFEGWDLVLLHSRLVLGVLNHTAPWIQHYFEFCYLLCYPMVPLGFAALLLGMRRRERRGSGGSTERAIDRFWTTVLLAALATYALFPFFPSTPPRVLYHDLPGPAVAPVLRNLNFWILGNYGIPSSVFPSGHVAAVTATALAVRAELPRLGIVFLVAAASITAATVYGRYHYTADAVVGALIATAAFFIARRVHG
ncbi:MAG: phosphatase PAP2 family protein [Terriglobia bacterium]